MLCMASFRHEGFSRTTEKHTAFFRASTGYSHTLHFVTSYKMSSYDATVKK